MKPVVSVAEMRSIDREEIAKIGIDRLIERAGFGAAQVARRMLGGLYGRNILVVAGRGHNGDDGRAAARSMIRRGAKVTVIDAQASPDEIVGVDLVIDAAYGTGFHGDYRAPSVAPGIAVLSLDIPSGVDATTGVACEGAAIADVTVTFGAYTAGLFLGDGPDHVGELVLDDLGFSVAEASTWLMEDADLVGTLRSRGRNAHKWERALFVFAGSAGMTGAARLCSLGAMRAGASMVRLGAPGVEAGDFGVTEAVAMSLASVGAAAEVERELHRCKALVVGPGLSRDPHVAAEVRSLVTSTASVPIVIDADGLNALGQVELGGPPMFAHNSGVIVTPHDGEFSRLLGRPPGSDRVGSAQQLAHELGAVVLLKGPTTVIATPSGEVFLTNVATSALATAGTGDVLSGVIGALLTRGLTPVLAAALGAHLHGCASRRAPAEGMIASDLPALVAAEISRFATMAQVGRVDGGGAER